VEAEIVISDALLEEHRYINVDYGDWSDCTYESFKDDMNNIGIDVDRMYFSGFASQGDGACFEGRVHDWALFLKSLGYDNKLLVEHAKAHWSFGVKHSGHYYHENCTHFSGDLALSDGHDKDEFIYNFSPYPEDDLRSQSWYAIIHPFDGDKLEKEFTEAFKSHMRTLYRQLEKEYDYQTSDEAVRDTIIANELHIGE